MAFCPGCGKRLEEGANFCFYCGRDVSAYWKKDMAQRWTGLRQIQVRRCGLCPEREQEDGRFREVRRYVIRQERPLEQVCRERCRRDRIQASGIGPERPAGTRDTGIMEKRIVLDWSLRGNHSLQRRFWNFLGNRFCINQ